MGFALATGSGQTKRATNPSLSPTAKGAIRLPSDLDARRNSMIDLQTANEQLRQLQIEARAQRESQNSSVTQQHTAVQPTHPPWEHSWSLKNGMKDLLAARARSGIKSRREAKVESQPAVVKPKPRKLSAPVKKNSHLIRHFPDIGIATLRQHQDCLYRVWLLMRFLDEDGRGWLSLNELKQQLTALASPYRLFAWPRLRSLLHQGDGRYWQLGEDGRIWCKAAVHVVSILGLPRQRCQCNISPRV